MTPTQRNDATLTTAPVELRPLNADDERLYCHLYTDEETMRYIGPPLSTERAARSFRAALALSGRDPSQDQSRKYSRQASAQLFFAVVETGTGEAIGIGSLQNIDARQRRAEVGIMIEGAARARGYATAGLRALVRHAFSMLPVDEVRAYIAVAHAVVERLVISVGFSAQDVLKAGDGRLEQRIWNVRRHSWPPQEQGTSVAPRGL